MIDLECRVSEALYAFVIKRGELSECADADKARCERALVDAAEFLVSKFQTLGDLGLSYAKASDRQGDGPGDAHFGRLGVT